jgi:hypothetical protein
VRREKGAGSSERDKGREGGIGSHYVAQAGLELSVTQAGFKFMILLPEPPEF